MRLCTSVASLLALLAGPALAAPEVVTDIAATGSLVQTVLGDLGEVRVLLPGGAGAHHYQMRPSDAQALQSADLLVWVGPELTPWLAGAAGILGGTAAQLQLLEVEGTRLRGYAPAGGADHDHDPDHSGEGTDPHAWLDPQNAQFWLGAIAAVLADQDPENAAIYAANADAAAMRLAALEAEISAELAPHAEARFVVFHDAYGYFTSRFGLTPAIPVALGDASSPSAARINAIRTDIAQSGAVCAFPEYAHDPAMIRTVIEGTRLRLGDAIDPEGGLQDGGAGQYEAMLRRMGSSIATCLGEE